MNVLHISTCDLRGGAARAAWRLHEGLRAAGTHSRMLVHDRASADETVAAISAADSPGRAKIRRVLERMERQCIHQRRRPVSNTYFSLPAPDLDLSAHPWVRAADVIHLHWVAGMLAPGGVAALRSLKKPVVWTLHDQRAFTGGCHFSAGCHGYEKDCAACPQLTEDPNGLTRAVLADAIATLPGCDITVVCPSRWLADCARRSAVFSGARVEVIPYGLDTRVFRPYGKAEARTALDLDPDAVCFLFGADRCSEQRKGFGKMAEAIGAALKDAEFRESVRTGRIAFVSFGEVGRQFAELPVPIRCLERVDSDATLATICSAADALLFTSLEDNLPNVLFEAMCCGTPTLAFDVGGVPDIVTHETTGLLVPPGDCAKFAASMRRLASDPGLRGHLHRNCAESVPARFDLGIQASRYLALYRSITSDGSAMQSATLPATAPVLGFGREFADVFSRFAFQSERNWLRKLLACPASRRSKRNNPHTTANQ